MAKYKNYNDIPTPRTIKLPETLWQSVKTKAARYDTTVRQTVEEAVENEMHDVIVALQRLGVRGDRPHDKIVRVPLSKYALDRMHEGRRRTGLPAIKMLALCLHRHTTRRRRRPRSRGKRRGGGR